MSNGVHRPCLKACGGQLARLSFVHLPCFGIASSATHKRWAAAPCNPPRPQSVDSAGSRSAACHRSSLVARRSVFGMASLSSSSSISQRALTRTDTAFPSSFGHQFRLPVPANQHLPPSRPSLLPRPPAAHVRASLAPLRPLNQPTERGKEAGQGPAVKAR